MKISKVNQDLHAAALGKVNQEVKDLKAKLAGRQAALDQEKVVLQARNSVLNQQVKRLLSRDHTEREFISGVKEAIVAFDPLPLVAVQRPKASKTPMSAVLHLTDWHVGEVTQFGETEGWGKFNWEVAQDRVMQQLVPSFLRWVDAQRSGYVLDQLTICLTGDFISGDIHDELRRTNEFPVPVQTAKAGQLIAQAVTALAPEFKNVQLVEIGADNHSRLVQKPQAKQKAANSLGYLVYEIANGLLAKHANVTTVRSEGMKLLFDIGKFKFLGEHGDTVKSWQGVPWYGMEREVAREATRRMFDNRGFHHVIMGHYHVPFFSKFIVGGCLGGTSEYDHSCGRLSAPCQTSFIVGKHGAFNFVPFILR